MISMLIVFVTIAEAISLADSFVVKGFGSMGWARTSRSYIAASPSNADDLFRSDGWPAIEKELNTVPVFACANEQGDLLQYSVSVNEKTYQVPFFFCDVEDAKDDLEKARNETKIAGLDLIPVALGKAFKMWTQDQAVIVPSRAALMAAGAPPNFNPIGQEVPLFACMDIMSTDEDGAAVLPLFIVLEEANAAIYQAQEADGGDAHDFEVVSLSLPRAVELLATVPETPAFQFVPPKASIQYIQEYLSP